MISIYCMLLLLLQHTTCNDILITTLITFFSVMYLSQYLRKKNLKHENLKNERKFIRELLNALFSSIFYHYLQHLRLIIIISTVIESQSNRLGQSIIKMAIYKLCYTQYTVQYNLKNQLDTGSSHHARYPIPDTRYYPISPYYHITQCSKTNIHHDSTAIILSYSTNHNNNRYLIIMYSKRHHYFNQ